MRNKGAGKVFYAVLIGFDVAGIGLVGENVSMLVIRRKVTRHQAYTVFMLPGHRQEWPTSDYEHQEILRLYLQDRRHDGIVNDFTDYRIGEDDPQESSA